MDKLWYCEIDGVEKGPFSEEELQEFYQLGKLMDSSFVWKEGESEKMKMSEMELSTNSSHVDTPPAANHTVESPFDKVDRPRPWVRFWARMVDYAIITFVIGVILGITHMPTMKPPIPQMLVILIWVLVEAILLCTWGSTPGKALLKVHIRREGKKPTFLQGLSRSFSVWWLGVAAGIPIIMLITMIVACVKLSSGKITTWDKSGNYSVWHEKIGPVRIIITIAIFVFIVFLMYLSTVAK